MIRNSDSKIDKTKNFEMEDSKNGNEVVNEEEDANSFSFETTIAEAVWSKYWGDRSLMDSYTEDDRTPAQTPNAVMRNEGSFPGLYYEQKSQALLEFLKESLDRNIFFNHWTDTQKLKLANGMKREEVSEGTVVVKERRLGSYFYVVEEGEVTVSQKGVDYMVFDQHSTFGEVALLSNYVSQYSYKATTACTLWYVGRSTFLAISRENSMEILERKQSGIIQFEFFENLAQAKISKILNDSLYVKFGAGNPIYNENDAHSLFYIILTGDVIIVPSTSGGTGRPVLFKAGKCFGYAQMFKKNKAAPGKKNKPAPRNESATAVNDCELLVLNMKSFRRCFKGHKELFNDLV